MIGPLEIAIVVVLLLLFFGYRSLPAIGRWAGTNTRELKDSAKEMIGDKGDPKTLARSAGKGIREARELRDELTGKGGSTEPSQTSTDSSETQSRSKAS